MHLTRLLLVAAAAAAGLLVSGRPRGSAPLSCSQLKREILMDDYAYCDRLARVDCPKELKGCTAEEKKVGRRVFRKIGNGQVRGDQGPPVGGNDLAIIQEVFYPDYEEVVDVVDDPDKKIDVKGGQKGSQGEEGGEESGGKGEGGKKVGEVKEPGKKIIQVKKVSELDGEDKNTTRGGGAAEEDYAGDTDDSILVALASLVTLLILYLLFFVCVFAFILNTSGSTGSSASTPSRVSSRASDWRDSTDSEPGQGNPDLEASLAGNSPNSSVHGVHDSVHDIEEADGVAAADGVAGENAAQPAAQPGLQPVLQPEILQPGINVPGARQPDGGDLQDGDAGAGHRGHEDQPEGEQEELRAEVDEEPRAKDGEEHGAEADGDHRAEAGEEHGAEVGEEHGAEAGGDHRAEVGEEHGAEVGAVVAQGARAEEGMVEGEQEDGAGKVLEKSDYEESDFSSEESDTGTMASARTSAFFSTTTLASTSTATYENEMAGRVSTAVAGPSGMTASAVFAAPIVLVPNVAEVELAGGEELDGGVGHAEGGVSAAPVVPAVLAPNEAAMGLAGEELAGEELAGEELAGEELAGEGLAGGVGTAEGIIPATPSRRR